jgi:acid phosphatase type 7
MQTVMRWVIAFIISLAGLCPFAIRAGAEEAPTGVLLMAGDVTGCAPEDIERATATASLLVREIEQLNAADTPVRVLVLGDLAYDDGTKAEFACYEKTWGSALRKVLRNPGADVLPVPGNHEYNTSGAAGFFAAFKTNDWIRQNPEAYYHTSFSQDAAPAWRIIGLNSEIENDPASAQYKWLAQQLEDMQEKCVLAFWHRPVFSSGEHGHEGGNNGVPAKQQPMADMESLLAQHGASLIINGHDHNYEELTPHDENGRADPQGIRSFVVGTGGRKLRPLKGQRWKEISGTFDAETYGILRLDLYTGRYAWAFLPTDSIKTKYSGEATCRPRRVK